MARPRRGGIRVIAGSARGRQLVAPAIARPTTDRVRESLFGALDHGPGVTGRRVLDLYAGSGALAIEALSRGAERALLVERDRDAVRTIWQNLAVTEFTDRARVVVRSVLSFVNGEPPPDAPFDLVLLDPPYGEDEPAEVLGLLVRPGWLADDAFVVVERQTGAPQLELPEPLRPAWERRYGGTLLTVVTCAISDETSGTTDERER